ncbi:MAG: hypothetical protein HFE63_07960 [Clostridiales bacterium]|nr:hypothetical protein [Clostridiales bacterium]
MTSSEYKNTIEWTLSVQTPKDEDAVTTAKRILTNLGVPFPHGTLDEAVAVLSSRNYMGWNPCNAEQARYCANNGFTVIGVTGSSMIVILPEDEVVIVGNTLPKVSHPAARKMSELRADEIDAMHFFAFAILLEDIEPVKEEPVVMAARAAATTCSTCQVCQTCNTCQSCNICNNCQTGCLVSCQSCDVCDNCQMGNTPPPIYPSVTLTVPAGNRTELLNNNHKISISVSGVNCSRITVYINNSSYYTVYGNSLSISYPVNSAGKYDIYAVGTSSTGHTANTAVRTITITSRPPVNSVNIDNYSKSRITMMVGDELNVSCTVLPSDALDKSVSWTLVPENTSCASIVSTGEKSAKITALEPTNSVAIIAYSNENNDVDDYFKISIQPKIIEPDPSTYICYGNKDTSAKSSIMWKDCSSNRSLDNLIFKNGVNGDYIDQSIKYAILNGGCVLTCVAMLLRNRGATTQDKYDYRFNMVRNTLEADPYTVFMANIFKNNSSKWESTSSNEIIDPECYPNPTTTIYDNIRLAFGKTITYDKTLPNNIITPTEKAQYIHDTLSSHPEGILIGFIYDGDRPHSVVVIKSSYTSGAVDIDSCFTVCDPVNGDERLFKNCWMYNQNQTIADIVRVGWIS